jgi:hypothetical protein
MKCANHCALLGWPWRRAVEDYGVVYLGSAVFKIARLTFIALFFVHLFACIFYRIKETTAESREDVLAFYTSKHVEEDVSAVIYFYFLVTCSYIVFNGICTNYTLFR